MFDDFIGRIVEIQMGKNGMLSDKHEGLVKEVSESWIKIKVKNKITTINMSLVESISVDRAYDQIIPK
jgi:ribosome maturation factor RimP